MLDWYEKNVERLLRRMHSRLAVRLHPDLNRIHRDDHRNWALWFSMELVPAWKRRTLAALPLILGPCLVVVGVACEVDWRRMTPLGWMCVLAPSWMIGLAAGGVVFELARRRAIRARVFRAMRIFGFDVCPTCGYDMRGHRDIQNHQRTCPECGHAVSTLYVPLEQRTAG